ncbi:hypothetical protein B5M42_020895 [Paenibacillus athensensis]|uniref:DUF7678 domain-containing protein n=1 Tax=Paenibacillus athensensis TaxID=1967502 RepID=A0A4Y8PYQ7_9BACL|nr:hypothetical protein [Paenibacillus athensensis]MCD1261262.1 hypothetical protein [Paenibacillus athensensis]
MRFVDKGSWYMGKRFLGEVDGYYLEVQVFSEPSHYGIAQGRISRLIVYPDRSAQFNRKLVNYDRGWDGGPPTDSRIRDVIEKTVQYFDRKSIDWSFEARR